MAGEDKGKEAPGFERLKAFLETQMTMSHVYQPVMIRTMLEGGGAATRRQIAAAFLAADLSQLEYYEQVVGNYPGPVLKRRGIVEQDGAVFRLARGIRRMDEWQRAALIALCDARVADFVSRRQAAIWAHRAGNADPLPGTLRWQVMRRAMGRCEACGVSSEVRALEVDHIVPRSRGGTNDLWNLQALCSLCNVQKLDRDETDFHAAHEEVRHRSEGCEVCDQLAASEAMLAGAVTIDGAPGVAPRRHGAGWRALWQPEVNALRLAELATLPDDGSAVSMTMVGLGDGDAGHLVLLCG